MAEEIYEVPEHLRDSEPPMVQVPATGPWTTTPPAAVPTPVALAAAATRPSITHEEIVADHMALEHGPRRPATAKHLSASAPGEHITYFPLTDTLRLYAGWLLSWYFLIFAFGSYTYLRELPVQIPLVGGLFQSPVIISFAFGAFLFMLLTEFHRLLGRGKIKGVVLSLAWLGIFVLFRMNM